MFTPLSKGSERAQDNQWGTTLPSFPLLGVHLIALRVLGAHMMQTKLNRLNVLKSALHYK